MTIDHLEIAKLELQDGDILFIRVPPSWTHEQHTAAHHATEAAMQRAGVRATVLTGTTEVDLQIIRKDAA